MNIVLKLLQEPRYVQGVNENILSSFHLIKVISHQGRIVISWGFSPRDLDVLQGVTFVLLSLFLDL